jgi:hypothetical protein
MTAHKHGTATKTYNVAARVGEMARDFMRHCHRKPSSVDEEERASSSASTDSDNSRQMVAWPGHRRRHLRTFARRRAAATRVCALCWSAPAYKRAKSAYQYSRWSSLLHADAARISLKQVRRSSRRRQKKSPRSILDGLLLVRKLKTAKIPTRPPNNQRLSIDSVAERATQLLPKDRLSCRPFDPLPLSLLKYLQLSHDHDTEEEIEEVPLPMSSSSKSLAGSSQNVAAVTVKCCQAASPSQPDDLLSPDSGIAGSKTSRNNSAKSVDMISEQDQLLISSIIGSKTRNRFSLAIGSCVKQRRSIVCPEKDETMNSSGRTIESLLGSRRGSPEGSASLGSSGEGSVVSHILAASAPCSALGNSD